MDEHAAPDQDPLELWANAGPLQVDSAVVGQLGLFNAITAARVAAALYPNYADAIPPERLYTVTAVAGPPPVAPAPAPVPTPLASTSTASSASALHASGLSSPVAIRRRPTNRGVVKLSLDSAYPFARPRGPLLALDDVGQPPLQCDDGIVLGLSLRQGGYVTSVPPFRSLLRLCWASLCLREAK